MANKTQTARQARFGFDRNSSLGRFWRWWTSELLALTPQWLRESANSTGNALLIEIGSQSIVVWRWLQGSLVEQGRLDMQSADRASQSIAFQALIGKLRKRDDRIALWLSEGQSLVKQVDLPSAAAENLRQVLGFEMDRHTPFKADQVYFDFRVLRRDAQNNRLVVKLAAAPRAAIDGALDLLARWGVPAQAIYANGACASADDLIDLMPVERRVAKSTVLHLINLGLLLLAATLALAAIGLPIFQKRQAVIALMPVVEHAKQQAAAADALRREWEKLSGEYNFVLEKKQSTPPIVLQLDELSRLLPDDTWVQQFDLKGKEVQVQGETASSSKLIPLFESAKTLRDASFRSPVTKGSLPSSERFHLAAEVKPLPAGTLTAATAPPSAPTVIVAPAAVPPSLPATPSLNGQAQAMPAKTDKAADTGKPVQPKPPGMEPASGKPAPAASKPSQPAVPDAKSVSAAMAPVPAPQPVAPPRPAPPIPALPGKPAGGTSPKTEGQR